MSSEEDTFKRLQGLTAEEAMLIHESVYYSIVDELGGSNSVPISLLRERSDYALKPFGWTYDKLFNWGMKDIS